jgi:phenylpropionate dioxygenase-like ring-hydroxylating dioxygenase large terminal subunit
VKAYQEYQTQVMSEDRAMLESIQNGLGSARFAPGRMAPIEHGVQQVLTGYLDRMFGAA